MKNIKSEQVYGSGLYKTKTIFKFSNNNNIEAVVSISQDWVQDSLEYRVVLSFLEAGKRKYKFINHEKARLKCNESHVDFNQLILNAKLNHYNRINPART